MDAIVVKGLSKTFRTKIKESGLKGSIKSIFKPEYRATKAVDSISFTIPKGQLVGFIGPNGAGKSTTLKMLTGILYPSDGEASVLGITPWKDRKKLAYSIGTVFGQRSQLWMHLPPQDSFDLFAAIYDLKDEEYRTRLSHLVKTFEIEAFLNIPVRKLSLGQRMRCELVAALLHKPEVLYLDEPSIGLDILAKKALREHIKRINKEEGVTIILTSHDMDDIEEVCNRVVVINHGRIVHDSSVDEMRKAYLKKKIITVYLKKPAKRYAQAGVTTIKGTPDEVCLEVDTAKADIQKVLSKVTTHYQLDDIEIADPPIEEIIEEIYKRKER
jgi:ABC-2 type transport system ATP-binding protein